MEKLILTDLIENVAKVTLNRPEKKNALSIALRDELSNVLADLSCNIDVKVVVITGAGNFFSAGFDLKEFQTAIDNPTFNATLWSSSDRFHHSLLFFPLPVIAAVNGPAIAGGFDLATLCDIRVCSERAEFSHPEISFGPVLYSPLHDLVGGAVAREISLTGRKIDAEEALSLKLVSSVVQSDKLEEEANQFAKHIKQASRENLLKLKSKIIDRARIPVKMTLEL